MSYLRGNVLNKVYCGSAYVHLNGIVGILHAVLNVANGIVGMLYSKTARLTPTSNSCNYVAIDFLSLAILVKRASIAEVVA
jgi:hypothetical protein